MLNFNKFKCYSVRLIQLICMINIFQVKMLWHNRSCETIKHKAPEPHYLRNK
jgi:hypothetical protein